MPDEPAVSVSASAMGVRLTCTKWGCNFDEYVGQTIPLERLNTLANDHLDSHVTV